MLVLAVGLVSIGRDRSDEPLLALLPVTNAELYQELEFYLWLSEELESE